MIIDITGQKNKRKQKHTHLSPLFSTNSLNVQNNHCQGKWGQLIEQNYQVNTHTQTNAHLKALSLSTCAEFP